MKTYQIVIQLANNVSYSATADAESGEEAVDIVLGQREAIDAIGDIEILSIQVDEAKERPEEPADTAAPQPEVTSGEEMPEVVPEVVPEVEPEEDTFFLEETILPGCWMLTDLKNNVIVKFHEHHFGEQMLLTDIEGNLIDPISETALAERAKNYLLAKHPELM